MCDFRKPPTGIQDITSNEIYICEFKGGVYSFEVDTVIDPGMYLICGTGGFYQYFKDGKWWKSCTGWNDSVKYPTPVSYSKYKFLFKEDNIHV